MHYVTLSYLRTAVQTLHISTMTLTNGNGTTSAILPPGIYVPTVTFFKPTREQELDLETHVQHMTVLAEAGVAGVVLQGSTGEAVTLSRDERIAVSLGTEPEYFSSSLPSWG